LQQASTRMEGVLLASATLIRLSVILSLAIRKISTATLLSSSSGLSRRERMSLFCLVSTCHKRELHQLRLSASPIDSVIQSRHLISWMAPWALSRTPIIWVPMSCRRALQKLQVIQVLWMTRRVTRFVPTVNPHSPMSFSMRRQRMNLNCLWVRVLRPRATRHSSLMSRQSMLQATSN
jgi:hypothetical protein